MRPKQPKYGCIRRDVLYHTVVIVATDELHNRMIDKMYNLMFMNYYPGIMALVLHLKYAENVRGKADRIAKVSFRVRLKATPVVK
ncbi:hypothetical protein KUTeg_016216 [Tegillarca granosa]|uniref:Uncharacterized protein n=1 Tax=Tegillarca granosa TaxID=220873 RepID=A0ABQ9EMR3_TEGGR|nr:hypothetical protein KUTeg_016216 [Tegillarca granosa]